MKTRNTLVRLHKWQVDEKRRRLAELYASRADFEKRMQAVEISIVREQEFINSAAGIHGDVGFSYGAFAQAAIMQRDNIQRSIQSIDEMIVEALESVGESYKALKRQEIAAANQESRKTKERDRLEQIASDDQAIEGHQRKVSWK